MSDAGEGTLLEVTIDLRGPAAKRSIDALRSEVLELARRLRPIELVTAARREGSRLHVAVFAASAFRRYRKPGSRSSF